MKAVLIVPASEPTPCPRVPVVPLFPLLDRPFLQHIVEAIVRRGIREITVVHGRGMEPIRQFLRDGVRWGCVCSYHQLTDSERVELFLSRIATGDEPILIGHADQLPALPAVLRVTPPGLLFGAPGKWSGWAVVTPDVLRSVPTKGPLGGHLESSQLIWVDAGQPVVLRSLEDVPAAQKALLNAMLPGTIVPAHETQPGVWMGRNVRRGAGVNVVPPSFVGDNAILAAGSSVGPAAVVGANCVLGPDSSVRDSTVCAGSYVGVGVQLRGVIVDGRCLVIPQHRSIETVDRRILDRLSPGLPFSAGLGLLVAGITAVVALPVSLMTYSWRRHRRPSNIHPPSKLSRQVENAPVRGIS